MNICFLGGNISKALRGEYLGGAEKQIALISKGLSERGNTVSVLEPGLKNTRNTFYKNIKIVRTWTRGKGLPVVRFFIYRIPILLKRLMEIKPDIIYSRGTSMYGAIILFVAKTFIPSKFVWAIAHDQDLKVDLTYIRTQNKSWYARINAGLLFNFSAKYLLKNSDYIFCQTIEQEEILKKKRGPVCIIENIYEQITIYRNTNKSVKSRNSCLWIGKFTGFKGENDLLEIARLIPNIQIHAVGRIDDNIKKSSLFKKLLYQKNITFYGQLNHSDVLKMYTWYNLLIHTARAEGFCNIFLEAWAFGCPVISLHVNPNKLLSDGRLGYCTNGNIQEMKKKIMYLVNDNALRKQIAMRSIEYVKKVHSEANVIDKIEKIFKSIL